MICPVLCFTCGKRIDYLYEEFIKQKKNKSPKEVLDKLNVKRLCCRTVIISTTDISEYLPYI
jgi:DNA-directed RNA polymerase subunit N (RpoN/RPB10)